MHQFTLEQARLAQTYIPYVIVCSFKDDTDELKVQEICDFFIRLGNTTFIGLSIIDAHSIGVLFAKLVD